MAFMDGSALGVGHMKSHLPVGMDSVSKLDSYHLRQQA